MTTASDIKPITLQDSAIGPFIATANNITAIVR